MKQLLTIVAMCLVATPALAEDVSDHTLAALGLSDLQRVDDSQGMQIRGMSSNATTSGTSLVFGQLVADLPTGTNFIVVSDINHGFDTAHNHGLNAFSSAIHHQGSAAEGSLVIQTNPGFSGHFSGLAGQAVSSFAGFGKAFGQ